MGGARWWARARRGGVSERRRERVQPAGPVVEPERGAGVPELGLDSSESEWVAPVGGLARDGPLQVNSGRLQLALALFDQRPLDVGRRGPGLGRDRVVGLPERAVECAGAN